MNKHINDALEGNTDEPTDRTDDDYDDPFYELEEYHLHFNDVRVCRVIAVCPYMSLPAGEDCLGCPINERYSKESSRLIPSYCRTPISS